MEIYYGEQAKKYTQSKSKVYLVNPAIFKLLPAVTTRTKLLDLACGNGDLYPEIIKRRYEYVGIDNSADLLKRAQADYLQGKFIKADARNFTKQINQKFDVVLINMLLPALPKKQDIFKVFEQASKAIGKNGRIIVSTNNPGYDPYMTHGLLKGKNVKTQFTDYFDSPKRFDITTVSNSQSLHFTDYHYTFADYIHAIHASGLHLCYIDECKVPVSLKKKDADFFQRKHLFSSFLILECVPLK